MSPISTPSRSGPSADRDEVLVVTDAAEPRIALDCGVSCCRDDVVVGSWCGALARRVEAALGFAGSMRAASVVLGCEVAPIESGDEANGSGSAAALQRICVRVGGFAAVTMGA
jgi:hypothetical protein